MKSYKQTDTVCRCCGKPNELVNDSPFCKNCYVTIKFAQHHAPEFKRIIYYVEHKEQIKNYREQHKEQVKQTFKNYRIKNREKWNEYQRNYARKKRQEVKKIREELDALKKQLATNATMPEKQNEKN